MASNTEININSLPQMNYKRSKFKYYKNYKTTFNCGDLICTYANELVQPGDTFKMDVSLVARMMTPYQPVMDNAYLETFAFKVEWLDIWDNCKAFFGENPNAPWVNTASYVTPQVKVAAGDTVARHTLLDYLGWPRHAMTSDLITAGGLSVNTYVFIYNEWFRNQNYIAPYTVNTAGTTITYNANSILTGGTVLKVMKPHTRYTVGLPEPQKSPTGPITLPLGTTAPVLTQATPHSPSVLTGNALGLRVTSGSPLTQNSVYEIAAKATSSTGLSLGAYAHNDILTAVQQVQPSNLFADLSSATAATISALRVAAAVQQIYEAMGAYGTLYRQIIKSLWGTDTSDTAQHIPEFLGSRKTPINMDQVIANTEGTNQDLGATGAMSLTNDYFHLFTKSFQEHCVLMVLNCVRTDAHYAQGLPRQYFKAEKFDYYWNKLAGLSFQPIYTGEVYTVGGTADKAAFSYLPAWSEYRNEQDQLTSMFNPDDSLFLQQWTYVNKYNSAPSMGQSFIEENATNIDRTLYVASSTTDNFMLDMTFIITKVTEVPFYGTPGLTRF